jgi:hypothetical protein
VYVGAENTERPRWGVRYAPGETVARSENTVLPAGELVELHVTFDVTEETTEDLFAFLRCAQPGARIRLSSFRMYEGDYVPAGGSGPAVGNLLRNGDFAAGDDAWLFEFTQQRNVKRTYRRTSCLLTRLLANMGAAGDTPILRNVSLPAGDGDTRWLDGLYLDVPEGWDYPYLFFRW